MRIPHPFKAALLGLFVLPLFGTSCGWPFSGATLLISPTNNLALMNQAEALVAPQYPMALLIEALGAAKDGSGTVADDVNRWQFRFAEDPNSPGAGTVWVDYENGQFKGPFFTSQGLLGTEFVRIPRNMDLAEAIGRMRTAGFTGAFKGANARKPLTFPPAAETFYIFSLSDRFVLVGMTSGNVTSETSRSEPTFLTP